jgi:hypothetical protein
MKQFFEYCRFTAPPRALMDDPNAIKDGFDRRAVESGGALFGCWRSLVGLGLARDEGIAVSAYASEAAAHAAPAPEFAGLACSERRVIEASVRPTSDAPPQYEGVYVFRWFDIDEADWEDFRDMSDAAWPNMEQVFDVNICGFWRARDVDAPAASVLLLTRYADLSVWEASRWWRNPDAAADASMSRFKKRNEIINATVAYPSLPIL